MQNINGIDNKLVAGIDIGSENIYCAIGSLIPENSRIKLLGIGKCSVKESFNKGSITNRNQLIEQLETAINEAEDAISSDAENKNEVVREAVRKIDKAYSKGVIKSNYRNRKKSKLTS